MGGDGLAKGNGRAERWKGFCRGCKLVLCSHLEVKDQLGQEALDIGSRGENLSEMREVVQITGQSVSRVAGCS